jgi:hypothetical protein
LGYVTLLLCVQEYNDALLVTYLSSMTKGSQLLADVQEKHNIVHSEREDPRESSDPRRRRPGGYDEDFGGGGGFGSSHGPSRRGPRSFMGDLMGMIS